MITMHESSWPTVEEGRVVRFVPPAEFNRQASDWMADVNELLEIVEQRGGDGELTREVARIMTRFHRLALQRGLHEIAELAGSVAKALEKMPGEHVTARRVVALSLAAVSQIQCLLNPSVEQAGRNALRIMDGLLRRW
ncbi:MAG: hypothetical protein G8237_05450 [Magnetococcales bacterium]|nr:hypothetical protein [Magnetococcales bacterium]NGZ05784.1 hypothetical protein [Magnetococcales bacterium]